MNSKPALAIALFAFFVIAVFVLGVMVPTFYDWSEADQSRPSPWAAQWFFGEMGFLLALWLVLPWIPAKFARAESEPDSEESDAVWQFNLRTLLIVTTAIAIVIAGWINLRVVTATWIIAISLAVAAWYIAHELSQRWNVAAMLACMYFPFVWVFFSKTMRRSFDYEQLFAALGLPSFLPTLFLSRFVGQHPSNQPWLFVLLTVIEFLIGCAILRLGPRRSVAWIVFVLFLSFNGSLLLNALIRI